MSEAAVRLMPPGRSLTTRDLALQYNRQSHVRGTALSVMLRVSGAMA